VAGNLVDSLSTI